MKRPLVHSQWIIKSLMALVKLAHYSLNMAEERFIGGLPLAHCFCAIEYQERMLSSDININARANCALLAHNTVADSAQAGPTEFSAVSTEKFTC